MIVRVCLNGARPRDFHPRLPVTVDAIVADAVEAVAAGAAELHLQVRGPDGVESLAPAAVDAARAALRDRLPGTLTGISTGTWIEQDDDRRLTMIDGWRLLPDHASANLGEAGAPAVIERLHRRGIGVEAGLASVADAERLVWLGLASLALRILVEIEEQALDAAIASADAIPAALARAGVRKPVPRGRASPPVSGSRTGPCCRMGPSQDRTPLWSRPRSRWCAAPDLPAAPGPDRRGGRRPERGRGGARPTPFGSSGLVSGFL